MIQNFIEGKWGNGEKIVIAQGGYCHGKKRYGKTDRGRG